MPVHIKLLYILSLSYYKKFLVKAHHDFAFVVSICYVCKTEEF
jgi:hypothetical protein